jgi:hypothetical protein
MSKTGSIQIHNSKRRIMVLNEETGEKERKTVSGYIVKSVGKNGEILQSSQVFNDVKAVKIHLNAMDKLWNTGSFKVIPQDNTEEQKFVTLGLAEPGK